MPFPHQSVKAICFDYGNTLIAYGPEQVAYQYKKLENFLKELFGRCDSVRLKAIRDRQIVAPFSDGYRENDLREICSELIHELYDVVPSKDQIDALMQVRYESFVRSITLSHDVLPLLNKLRQKYRLGFLSNYPCSRSIRDSMAKIGLSDIFDATVVSGEVGYVKPHPKPFETMLDELGLLPSECIYVGDNWLADIQGAKRIGMGAIYTTQFVPYETFEPTEGDSPPDVIVQHLAELEQLLL